MQLRFKYLSILSFSSFIFGLGATACKGKGEVTETQTTTDASTTESTSETEGETTTETDSDSMLTDSGSDSGSDTEEPKECVSAADCVDDDECTVHVCSANDTCELESILNNTNACRPAINVNYPPRGATIIGSPGNQVVTVTGTVTSGGGAIPIASLQLNGNDVAVDSNGNFSHDFSTSVGGNTLDFLVEDEQGGKRTRVQSFLWSTEYLKPEVKGEQMVSEGLGVYLSQAALDDKNQSLPADDIATLFKLALDNFDLASLFDPNKPVATNVQNSGYNVYVKSISFASTQTGLQALDGGIALTALIKNIKGTLEYVCTQDWCKFSPGNINGDFSITKMTVNTTALLKVEMNANVQVTIQDVQITINPNDLILPLTGNANIDNAIKSVLITEVIKAVEPELTNTIENQLGPALENALNTLKIDTTLALPNLSGGGDPIQVDFLTKFIATDFHDGIAPPQPSPPQGGTIRQSGGAYFKNDIAPYTNEGIPSRVGCGLGGETLSLPMTSEVELGLHDDLLNQILYGAWRGGLLEFTIPPELIDNNFVKVTNLKASAMLAPTASDCNSPQDKLLAHIGDLRLDAELTINNNPMSFTSFTSMLLSLDIKVNNTLDGIDLGVAEVVDMKTELTANEDNMIASEEIVKSILESTIQDILISQLKNGGLGGIALPEIDISSQLGLNPGTATLKIKANKVSRPLQGGTTILEATF